MREFSAPATFPIPETGNLTDDVLHQAARRPGSVGFARQVDDGWQDVTYAEFHAEVVATAKGLVALGVGAGDPVGLLSRTRYEWTLLDYAIWWAGAVTVPIYESSAAEQIGWVLGNCGAVACIVENDQHRSRVESIRDRLPALARVESIDSGALAMLRAAGESVSDQTLEHRRSSVIPGSLATVIYTSGTTGRPKGCQLTHANFMVELGAVTEELAELFERPDASTLVFLPLAHIFARIIQVGCVRAGVRMGHTNDLEDLAGSFAKFRPTFILGVPRVFEKVYNTASRRAHSGHGGRVFEAAAQAAIAYSRAQDGSGPGLLLRARHRVFDRLVYARLRAALGGRTRYAMSGGAPLGERLTHFYRGIGVPVLVGYGLTESTAALTVNVPGAIRIGSVGRPLPGTDVRVGDDGELLFRGGQVFPGYWDDEAATAAAFTPDGWFHSGDVGEIDEEGFVRITGRQKEILVTAGGKNVAPAVLEEPIRSHALVSQVLVVGDGRPFIGALITLDPDSATAWAAEQGRPDDLATLARDEDLRQVLQGAVDEANAHVSKAESIREFRILATDWTEESGHLTPSLKLKRALVLRDFGAEVAALYR
ncbi:MAG: AMP-dependent synthetase/ligase [Nocardioidaceae bacterium]